MTRERFFRSKAETDVRLGKKLNRLLDDVSTAGGGGGGTVTSVALTEPSWRTVTGSPITTAGTLGVIDNNQSANKLFAGPSSGGAAAPAFRGPLVSADLAAGAVADYILSTDATANLWAVNGGQGPVQRFIGKQYTPRLLRAHGGGQAGVEQWVCVSNSTGHAQAPANSNTAFGQMMRWRSTTATSAASQNRWHMSDPSFTALLCIWRGNAAGLGGFYVSFGWGPVSGASDTKRFCGLNNPADPTIGSGSQVSSLTNIVCFGYDSTDSNVQFMHNDSTGTATKANLGTSFPARTTEDDWYLGEIWEGPNEGTIHYRLRNIITGADSGEQTATSNLPSNSTWYAAMQITANTTAGTAVVVDESHIYVETPY
jgi:hypothetical protein